MAASLFAAIACKLTDYLFGGVTHATTVKHTHKRLKHSFALGVQFCLRPARLAPSQRKTAFKPPCHCAPVVFSFDLDGYNRARFTLSLSLAHSSCKLSPSLVAFISASKPCAKRALAYSNGMAHRRAMLPSL